MKSIKIIRNLLVLVLLIFIFPIIKAPNSACYNGFCSFDSSYLSADLTINQGNPIVQGSGFIMKWDVSDFCLINASTINSANLQLYIETEVDNTALSNKSNITYIRDQTFSENSKVFQINAMPEYNETQIRFTSKTQDTFSNVSLLTQLQEACNRNEYLTIRVEYTNKPITSVTAINNGNFLTWGDMDATDYLIFSSGTAVDSSRKPKLFINYSNGDNRPFINIISPSGNFSSMDENWTFTFNVSDDFNISNTTLYIWNSTGEIYYNLTNFSTGININYSINKTFPAGNYIWAINSIDNASKSTWTSNYTLYLPFIVYIHAPDSYILTSPYAPLNFTIASNISPISNVSLFGNWSHGTNIFKNQETNNSQKNGYYLFNYAFSGEVPDNFSVYAPVAGTISTRSLLTTDGLLISFSEYYNSDYNLIRQYYYNGTYASNFSSSNVNKSSNGRITALTMNSTKVFATPRIFNYISALNFTGDLIDSKHIWANGDFLSYSLDNNNSDLFVLEESSVEGEGSVTTSYWFIRLNASNLSETAYGDENVLGSTTDIPYPIIPKSLIFNGTDFFVFNGFDINVYDYSGQKISNFSVKQMSISQDIDAISKYGASPTIFDSSNFDILALINDSIRHYRSFPNGDYIWNIQICDTNGVCMSDTQNKTLAFNAANITTGISSSDFGYNSLDANITFLYNTSMICHSNDYSGNCGDVTAYFRYNSTYAIPTEVVTDTSYVEPFFVNATKLNSNDWTFGDYKIDCGMMYEGDSCDVSFLVNKTVNNIYTVDVVFVSNLISIGAAAASQPPATWDINSTIINGLPDIGSNSAPSIFNNGQLNLIAGNNTGGFSGYTFNGVNWVVNATLIAGLLNSGNNSVPSVFQKDGTWYLISGILNGTFMGFKWNGTQWVVNTTINSSLPDIGSNSAPTVFYKDGMWNIISGSSVTNTWFGYTWNGTQWLTNNTIKSGLGNVGTISIPTVFLKNNILYLVAGGNLGTYRGYNWNGTTWQSDSIITSGLYDIGSNSAPNVFQYSNTWYLVSGDINGLWFGFKSDIYMWRTNNTIITNLPAVGANSASNVFYKDSTWYMISGNSTGLSEGFNWNGTGWQSNTTIVNGLPSITNKIPNVFYKDNIWYLVSGNSAGTFNGFKWNGTQWVVNTTINSSLPDIGSNSAPTVFYKDGMWNLISGNLAGTFNGFKWNGTQWIVNSTINSSLPDIGANSIPTVFQKDNSNWYLISGGSTGLFTGYKWNGTTWQNYSIISGGLSDAGSNSAPNVFYKDLAWYLISGNLAGTFNGYIAEDYIPPQYSLNSTNSTLAGTFISHIIYWTDDINLSGYILSFDNGTGSFVNDSWVSFSGAANWSNVTKFVNSTVGSTINWIFYANDSSNNFNTSSIFIYQTTTSGTFTTNNVSITQNFSSLQNLLKKFNGLRNSILSFNFSNIITKIGNFIKNQFQQFQFFSNFMKKMLRIKSLTTSSTIGNSLSKTSLLSRITSNSFTITGIINRNLFAQRINQQGITISNPLYRLFSAKRTATTSFTITPVTNYSKFTGGVITSRNLAQSFGIFTSTNNLKLNVRLFNQQISWTVFPNKLSKFFRTITDSILYGLQLLAYQLGITTTPPSGGGGGSGTIACYYEEKNDCFFTLTTNSTCKNPYFSSSEECVKHLSELKVNKLSADINKYIDYLSEKVAPNNRVIVEKLFYIILLLVVFSKEIHWLIKSRKKLIHNRNIYKSKNIR